MGNRIKGTFPFSAGGADYVMQFTANGMCALEDVTGTSATAFLKDLEEAGDNLSFKSARLLFWAGLQEHHEGISQNEAGKIITDLGGLVPALELAGKAVQASLPTGSPDKGAAGGAAGNGQATP